MPKKRPEPFWRSERNCWFVQIDKKQHRLSPDEAEAWRLYHALMAAPPEPAKVVRYGQDSLVVEILDAFLGWALENSSPKTYQWRKENLETFGKGIPRNLTVADLKPFSHYPRDECSPELERRYTGELRPVRAAGLLMGD